MAKTPRFGLEYWGGAEPGSLQDKGGKFTRTDRFTIDRILAALEYHEHGGGERLEDPTASPSLQLQAGNGTLSGGSTYYYKVSYIDQFGLETAASDEVGVAMPAKVSIPTNPGVNAVAGGTLDATTYEYGVTALDSSGETPLSATTSVTIVGTNQTVEVTPTMPAGADEVSIWRRSAFEAGFTRLTTQASAATFTDDGSIAPEPCATDPDKSPPSSNTTGSSGAVLVTAPTGDLTQPTLARRWRIYRSTTSGVYGPETLLIEVTATTTEGGSQLVEEFLDDGTASLASGTPLLSSTTLTPSQAVEGSGAGGVDATTLLLRSVNDVVWRITSTRVGEIETRLMPMPTGIASFFADEGVVLQDDTLALWRLTVSDAGQITTTSVGQTPLGEVDYDYGRGPELSSVDGAVSYLLSVEDDGALTTYGQDDSTVVEGVGVRRFIVSATQPTAPQEGDVWLDIS